MRKLSLLVALAAAACSSSSSSNDGKKVAIFVDDYYVDYSSDRFDPEDPSPEGSEAYNMKKALEAMGGLNVNKTRTTDFDADVAWAEVLIIPEQEEATIADDIPSDSQDAVYALVHDNGGTLILAAPDDGALALINLIFGYSLASGDSASPDILMTPAATGSTFATGATTLSILSATTVVASASLPMGASIVYDDDNGNGAVVVIPEGLGNIIILGWDFYNAMPVGSQDGGWLGVLAASVNYVTPVP